MMTPNEADTLMVEMLAKEYAAAHPVKLVKCRIYRKRPAVDCRKQAKYWEGECTRLAQEIVEYQERISQMQIELAIMCQKVDNL